MFTRIFPDIFRDEICFRLLGGMSAMVVRLFRVRHRNFETFQVVASGKRDPAVEVAGQLQAPESRAANKSDEWNVPANFWSEFYYLEGLKSCINDVVPVLKEI
jgi:hypothetical protein